MTTAKWVGLLVILGVVFARQPAFAPPFAFACCLPDGSCRFDLVLNCEAAGGSPQDVGLACLGVEACCLPDSTCADIDALCCTSQGGVPQGPGSVCAGPICQPASPTATPTNTPTQTPTATPTNTRVPEGGSCTDISQCESGLFCVEQICAHVVAPAPAASNTALVIALSLLAAIGGFAILRRRDLKHYLWSM